MIEHWKKQLPRKFVSLEEAIDKISRGDRIFLGTGCGCPEHLVQCLFANSVKLADSELVHFLTLGRVPQIDHVSFNRFRHNAFFIGEALREPIQNGFADYTPIMLSDIPELFSSRRFHLDVALIQVSPPDRHGVCSLGVSVDIVKSAAENARLVIAQMNRRMPRTHGDSFIPINELDYIVEHEEDILTFAPPARKEVAEKIARFIAHIIENGSTIQTGIGSIPDGVLEFLKDKRDLGVHTEVFSDGIVDLVEAGVITNARKTLHRGKIITSFVMGSKRLYDFVDNNPLVEFHSTEYVNDPYVIARNDKMVSINSALTVDITGQVCSDSIGFRFYSGIGGQADFTRGASRSKGGKAIIALPSVTDDGKLSRIVLSLAPGCGVVVPRGEAHYIITEWGMAYLHGKTIRERVLALINIAHPDFREQLFNDARKNGLLPADQAFVVDSGSNYPYDEEKWETLPDGTKVFTRPLKNTDEILVQDLFYHLSDNSVYLRFFTKIKTLHHDKAQKIVNLDYKERMGIAVCIGEGADEMMTGFGQYELNPTTNYAEVAFLVRDEWQRRGIGSMIQSRLIEYAKRIGITGFRAEILSENRQMLALANRSGCRTTIIPEESVRVAVMDFDN